MEIDIEEDENELELTYPYEEVDPLNPPLPAFEFERESSTTAIPREDGDRLLPGFMRRDIDSLFGQMVNISRQLCGREMAYPLVEKKGKAKDKFYGKLVEKLGNAEEKVECKKLKKELKEARGFLFEERLNEAIDVPVEDEKSPSSEPRGSPRDSLIMPPKSAPLTQAAVRRMIKESVDVVIATERARHENVGNDARGSGPVRGQDAAPVVRECTFARFMKCNPTVFRVTEGAVELRRWFEKTESVFGISECVEGKKVKFIAAILQGPTLTWWISKIAIMGLETVNQMP
ncbi:hypothetical protein Tco_0480491 [Tanacetum coccineum]